MEPTDLVVNRPLVQADVERLALFLEPLLIELPEMVAEGLLPILAERLPGPFKRAAGPIAAAVRDQLVEALRQVSPALLISQASARSLGAASDEDLAAFALAAGQELGAWLGQMPPLSDADVAALNRRVVGLLEAAT